MDQEFDPAFYVRAPKLDVPNAVGVTIKLLTAMPREAPANVRKAARRLRRHVVELQKQWGARLAVPEGGPLRPYDTLDDTAWRILVERVESASELPANAYPIAARAAEILRALFPKRLNFTQLEYTAQWAAGTLILDQIAKDPALARDLDAIAGPEYLKNARDTHKVYGDALGITRRRDEQPEVPNLAKPLRAVTDAIGAYGIALLSMIDAEGEEGDEAYEKTLRAVRTALRPLDEYRASAARAGTAGEEAPEPVGPDTPVPNPS